MALVPFPSAQPVPQDDDPQTIKLTDPDLLDDDGAGARMSFLEHLDELRKRLIYSVVAIVLGCAVSFIFIQRIFEFVFVPIRAMLSNDGTFIATEAPEVFMLYLKVAALSGFFLALPFVLWQLWLFIAPGLYAHEKKFAVPFVFFSSVFFFAGAFFSHRIAFPWTFQFFLGYESEFVRIMPKLGPTFGLYVKMLLGFGAIFQMPMLVLFLARMGMITAGFMIRNTKYAVLIIFILGAILSPGGDVVSQALMAGPMLLLYGLSIGVAWIFGKKRTAL
jgi:sec-independent protein translocase protein TatC